jgi:hypothetical protein
LAKEVGEGLGAGSVLFRGVQEKYQGLSESKNLLSE